MATHLCRAALAGAATGLRSTVAMAALINARGPGLPPLLTRGPAGPLAWLGVALELVADKLPTTPSRLEPAGLVGRLVFAGAAGAVLARAARRPVFPAVLVACGADLVSAKLGHDARVAAVRRLPSLAVAAAEDALAVGLAAAASRPVGGTPFPQKRTMGTRRGTSRL